MITLAEAAFAKWLDRQPMWVQRAYRTDSITHLVLDQARWEGRADDTIYQDLARAQYEHKVALTGKLESYLAFGAPPIVIAGPPEEG